MQIDKRADYNLLFSVALDWVSETNFVIPPFDRVHSVP
jgi:hypothetical protein